MDLFVHSADGVAIAHFEFGEILVFIVETLLEVRDTFYSIFALLYLLHQSLHFDLYIALQLNEYLK